MLITIDPASLDIVVTTEDGREVLRVETPIAPDVLIRMFKSMSKMYDLPKPGDKFDGRKVVASIWVNDETATALLLLLNETAPHYGVVDIAWSGGDWTVVHEQPFSNVVPAVAAYVQQGGDY